MSRHEKEERGRLLFSAILEQNVGLVKQILDYPVDLGHKQKGDCAIHIAARIGIPEILQLLLSKGDNVNRLNENQNTPLHFAAKEGKLEAVLLLVRKGANKKLKNKDGDSPLHFAVVAQAMDFIEQLLSLKMSPNVQNNMGLTPLHVAVKHSRQEIMEILLVYRANPTIADKEGKIPADIATDEAIVYQLNRSADLIAATDTGSVAVQGFQIDNRTRTDSMAIKLKRVGVVITSFSTMDNLPSQLYCRREKSENSLIHFNFEKGEEIASDIFFFRLTDSRSPVSLSIEIPIYSAIGAKEEPVLKFLDGGDQAFSQTKEIEGTTYCNVELDLTMADEKIFVVYTRPRKESIVLDTVGTKVASKINEDFQLDIPASAFKEGAKISLTIFDTKETFQEPASKKSKMIKNLLTDIYLVNAEGNQPKKEVVVSFPIDKIVPGDDIVIVTADESKLDDAKCLELVPAKPSVEGKSISFTVKHFCIHVAVPKTIYMERRQEVFNQIMSATKRQRPASFFVMTYQRSHSETVVLVEVSLATKAARRIQHWQSKGYERHGTELKTFMLTPCDEFNVAFRGNIEAISNMKKLVFLPRRASFQPYRMTLKTNDEPPNAEAEIFEVRDEEQPEQVTEAVSETSYKLSVLKFILPTPPPPLDANKANKFEPQKSDIKKPLIQYLKSKFVINPWIDHHKAELQKTLAKIFSDFGLPNPPAVMTTKTLAYAGTVFQDWREHIYMLLIDNTVEDTAAMDLDQLAEHVLPVVLPPGGADISCLKLVTHMRCCAHQIDAFVQSPCGTLRIGRSIPVTSSIFWKEFRIHTDSNDLSDKKVWVRIESTEKQRIEKYRAKSVSQPQSEL